MTVAVDGDPVGRDLDAVFTHGADVSRQGTCLGRGVPRTHRRTVTTGCAGVDYLGGCRLRVLSKRQVKNKYCQN